MGVIRTIYHIARADLCARMRQYAFMVILGITMLTAYFFVPPADAGYATLYMDKYRGIYNSAWVGGSVALSTTLFLSLFGFYLVKNSVQREHSSRVGQIIASSSVKKLHYIAGKWLSNFAVLSIIVFVIILIALMMQWVRGEVMRIELWPLLSPFLFLTLPVMSVVAALAVLFEARPAWSGALGNLIYFAIYIMFVSGASNLAFGTAVITSDMIERLASLKPDYSGSYGIGILIREQPPELFEWRGVDWTGALMLQQLSLFLIAFLLILAAAWAFRGFQEAPHPGMTGSGKVSAVDGVEAAKGRRKRKTAAEPAHAGTHTDPGGVTVEASRIRAAALTPVTVRESFLPLVLAEWRLMMSSASLGWTAVAVLLAMLCLVMPVAVSSQWMIWPLTWLWPLVLWSGIGNREIRWRTQFLIASSPRFAFRQLAAVWAAGFVLACATGSGMLLRLIGEGTMEQLTCWLSAAILIPSLALVSGVLTKTNRVFEVLYMIVWYLGPLNNMPFLDFMRLTPAEAASWDMGLNSWAMSSIYIAISMGLLILAYMSRSRLAP